jgi:hypothetical protein
MKHYLDWIIYGNRFYNEACFIKLCKEVYKMVEGDLRLTLKIVEEKQKDDTH